MASTLLPPSRSPPSRDNYNANYDEYKERSVDNTTTPINMATLGQQNIAIVGASFAGLALAISLLNQSYHREAQLRRKMANEQQCLPTPSSIVHITIIDSSTPLSQNSCTHQVLGTLTLSSGPELLKQLILMNHDKKESENKVDMCSLLSSLKITRVTNSDDKKQEIASVDRLELKRWLYNQCKESDRVDILHMHRVVKLDNQSHHTKEVGCSINIVAETKLPIKLDDINIEGKGNTTRVLGPFDLIVGADGVLSSVRTLANNRDVISRPPPRIAVIGDARWVHEVWYDFGYRRIQRGADIALRDGLDLGKCIALQQFQEQDEQCRGRHLGPFDVNFIQQKMRRRRRAAVTIVIAFLAWFLFR